MRWMAQKKAPATTDKRKAIEAVDRLLGKPSLSDVEQVKDFLLWARKQRIAITQLTVGEVTLVVNDLGMPDDVKRPEPAPSRKSIYETFGGDALEQATNGVDTVEPTEEDDD